MIPNKLEKARPHYSLKLMNLLQTICSALEAVDLPTNDPHVWQKVVECDGLLDADSRYWVKAELAAAGWSCVFKLRNSENENLIIYMS